MDRKQGRTIEWECQRALHQYYQFVDQRMYEKAANLFTRDGPHRLGESYDKLVRMTEGWSIAERRGQLAFARD